MKKILPLALFALLAVALRAQYFEAGMFLGGSNYAGDLSEGNYYTTAYRPAMGLFGRYNFNERLSAKASLLQGEIIGSDADTRRFRERNLNFRSRIVELSATGEFNLQKFNIRADQKTTPYLFAGVSAFYFNPQAQYQGSWYNLQPLGTEGQYSENHPERMYSRVQVAIPFGAGFKFAFSNKVNVGLELGFRHTFTDYLDDVSAAYPNVDALREVNPMAARLSYRSPEMTGQAMDNPAGTQRGDLDRADNFLFGGVTISFNLTNKYGLDFDEKYELFKDKYTDPELVRERLFKQKKKEKLLRRKSKKKYVKTKRAEAAKKKKEVLKKKKKHTVRKEGAKKLAPVTKKRQ